MGDEACRTRRDELNIETRRPGSNNGFSTGQFIANAILEKKQQGKVDDVLIIGRAGSVEQVSLEGAANVPRVLRRVDVR